MGAMEPDTNANLEHPHLHESSPKPSCCVPAIMPISCSLGRTRISTFLSPFNQLFLFTLLFVSPLLWMYPLPKIIELKFSIPWSRADRAVFMERFDSGRLEGVVTQFDVASRQERRNRAFISSLPESLGDGLGHRFMMINFDVFMSSYLNIGYTHRLAQYGSLTPDDDPLAVERMFGWLKGFELRRDVLKRSCANIKHVNDSCRIERVGQLRCVELVPRSQGGEFDYLVIIPSEIVECNLEVGRRHTCRAKTDEFLAIHNNSDTLFQMASSRCHHEFTINGYDYTESFLRSKYWSFHARYGAISRPPEREPKEFAIPSLSVSRALTLDPRRVHVAAHVRRGDFLFSPERQTIPDAVYADIVAEILHALRAAIGQSVPVTVHIFSEGVLLQDTDELGNHNITAMKPVYVNEHGKSTPDRYWNSLLASHINRHSKGDHPIDAVVDIKLHIATDTVTAIHDMIAADFFIGSNSGLSVVVVSAYSRGVILLPLEEDVPIGEGKDYLGRIQYAYTSKDPVGVLERGELTRRVVKAVETNKLYLSIS